MILLFFTFISMSIILILISYNIGKFNGYFDEKIKIKELYLQLNNDLEKLIAVDGLLSKDDIFSKTTHQRKAKIQLLKSVTKKITYKWNI